MVEHPHSMAYMEFRNAQTRDLVAKMFQQQQTVMEAVLNSERSRPAAWAQGINEKYYKRVESFNGHHAWRD